ncbi:MAG: hypothetical protein DI564_15015 [Rhodanobacter denitrificans]|uniref:Uncharacterized protein n=1 Tax=Rhodanobacter denitrificans TaxID=666685 RepID=A0A2W5K334_9GAMM|nr:MAG: hypothetical protein DI564_15015 [Rhodanobacter denitrificans]
MFSFEDVERAQQRAWVKLSTRAKIDFFEEMIELAYLSGALSPERLGLRDAESLEPRWDGSSAPRPKIRSNDATS